MFKIVLSILIMTYAYCSEDISSIEQSIKGYAKEYLYQDGVEASRVTRYIEEGIGILNIHLSEIQTQNDLEFIFQTAFDKLKGICTLHCLFTLAFIFDVAPLEKLQLMQ